MAQGTKLEQASSYRKLRLLRAAPDTFSYLLCSEIINHLKTRKLLDEMACGTRRHVVCQKCTNIVGEAVGVNGILEPVAKLLSGYTRPHPRRQDSAKVHAMTSSTSPTVVTWKTKENTSGI
jgi:hypothetical protein